MVYQTISGINSVLFLTFCIEFLLKKKKEIKLWTETRKLTDGQTHGKHLPVTRVFLQAYFFIDRYIYSAPWLLHTELFEISSDAKQI